MLINIIIVTWPNAGFESLEREEGEQSNGSKDDDKPQPRRDWNYSHNSLENKFKERHANPNKTNQVSVWLFLKCLYRVPSYGLKMSSDDMVFAI